MGGPPVDAKMAEQRSRHDVIVANMEATTREFVEAFTELAAEWVEQETGRLISNNPGRAKELGTDGLLALRANLDKLKSELRGLVEDIFLNGNYWEHRNLADQPVYLNDRYCVSADRHRVPLLFAEGISKLLGNLGKVYFAVGLVRDDDIPRTCIRTPDRQFQYLGSPPLNDRVAKVLERYTQLATERQSLAYSIRVAKDQKEQTEALDLWKQASCRP